MWHGSIKWELNDKLTEKSVNPDRPKWTFPDFFIKKVDVFCVKYLFTTPASKSLVFQYVRKIPALVSALNISLILP